MENILQVPKSKKGFPKSWPKEARAQLESSGISYVMAEALGIEYWPMEAAKGTAQYPGKTKKLIGPLGALCIPYCGSQEVYCRWRLLDEILDSKGKPIRYLQPEGSRPHLYLPLPLLKCPWSDVSTNEAIRIAITEGEKKAMALWRIGALAIGIGGVDSWMSDHAPLPDLAAIKMQGRDVDIVFDSDVVTKPNVAASCAKLATYLQGRGAMVRVVKVPAASDGSKKGIDDYLVAAPDPAKAYADLLAAAEEAVDPVRQLGEELVEVTVNGVPLIGRHSHDPIANYIRPTIHRPQDIRHGFLDRPKVLIPKRPSQHAFDAWLEWPGKQRYSGVEINMPGANDSRRIDRGTLLNLCPEFPRPPTGPSDFSLFEDLTNNVICDGDKDAAAFLWAMLAQAVQEPMRKTGVAVVLTGLKGIGKTEWFNYIAAMVTRRHAVTVSQQRHLTGSFNDHLSTALFVLVEEAVWAGDKQAESVLKDMITGDVLNFEGKNKPLLTGLASMTRLIFASNEDYAVPAGGFDERRFFVLGVSAKYRQNQKYFAALAKERETGGPAALLAFLAAYDYSGINLRSPPKTAALADQQDRHASPFQRWWYDCLARGSNLPAGDKWLTEIPKMEMFRLYEESAKALGVRRPLTEVELAKELRRWVPGLTDVQRRTAPTTQYKFQKRPSKAKTPEATEARQRSWVFPPLEQCQQMFDARMGTARDWERSGPKLALVR